MTKADDITSARARGAVRVARIEAKRPRRPRITAELDAIDNSPEVIEALAEALDILTGREPG